MVTKQKDATKKLFVLDTNVLMHDPYCLFQFKEHDVYLPMVTIEELDHHKKGTTEVARNARQATRSIDMLINTIGGAHLRGGISLEAHSQGSATGKLFLQHENVLYVAHDSLERGKADNQIIAVVKHLRSAKGGNRQAILVSKDINIRIKAQMLGFPAEDYLNDKTLDDNEFVFSGMRELPPDFWEVHATGATMTRQDRFMSYRFRSQFAHTLVPNEFLYGTRADGSPFYARVRDVDGRWATISTFEMYNSKHRVFGVNARNREQSFALSLLMDPEIDFVSLMGQAGTGKTLLTLAAGLEQVLKQQVYSEIIMTRVTVAVGEDIGYLPGNEEEKMGPWMGALDDNLDVLQSTLCEDGEHARTHTSRELMRSRVQVKNMGFIRGRSFTNKFLVIDESQNLTPKQMKTLITRAGPGTKVVCLGNVAQIDTPYLTEGSSGLTYVVDRFKHWTHSGHITLTKGERSRLSDFASDAL